MLGRRRKPPPGGNLPDIIPPSEEEAANDAEPKNLDLAYRERAQVDHDMSLHHVAAAGLRNKMVSAYIDNMVADRGMRQQYAGRILKYLEFYSGGVLVLLALDGFHPAGFHLQDDVMTALVGSTAIAAIGLVGFIARGLFRSPPKPPSERE